MIESAWLLAGLVKAAELLGSGFALVVGWTDPEGSRPYLGALLLAYYDPNGRLVNAGRVGSGINTAELERLRIYSSTGHPLQRIEHAICPALDPWATLRRVQRAALWSWLIEARSRTCRFEQYPFRGGGRSCRH